MKKALKKTFSSIGSLPKARGTPKDESAEVFELVKKYQHEQTKIIETSCKDFLEEIKAIGKITFVQHGDGKHNTLLIECSPANRSKIEPLINVLDKQISTRLGKGFSVNNDSIVNSSDEVVYQRINVHHVPESEEGFSALTDKRKERLLVAAVDLGTAYSGWAFQFYHEFQKDPTKVYSKNWNSGQHVSAKAPTCVLIKPDGKSLGAFGYDAETEYTALVEQKKHNAWYFFRRFKMKLYNQELSRNMTLTDEGGKQLPAITVFSLAIRYLKEDAMNESGRQLAEGLNPDDVHWVLTVPAIWDDEAKQFMREAAERADICSKNLTLALESEAAAIWCRFLPVKKDGDEKSLKTFKTGTKYLVVDAGGGTVDIAVQTVLENDMIENIHIPYGGDCGGTKVDEAYIKFLTDIVGQETMDEFKNTCLDDYIFLTREFELKKRLTDQSSRNPVVFRISASLPDLAETCTGKKFDELIKESIYSGQVKRSGDKLQTDIDIVTKMFAPQIDLIVDHISKLVEREIAEIEAILLVGGFSNCLMLQNAVKDRFGDSKTITVNDSDLAVMKGAAIFGHRPDLITQRISKYTYGVKCIAPFNGQIHPPFLKVLGERGKDGCRSCFDIHISAGQSIVDGEVQHKKTYKAKTEKQTTMELEIYRTLSSKPVLVTDEGCHVAGKLDLPLAGRGLNREVEVQMIYGGTEIQVEAKEMATGKVHKCSIDFLN